MRLLHAENVNVALGARVLIDALHWSVHKGEFWCVLGKNGVGKSSLLYTLAGLLPPHGGRLLLAGESVAQSDPATLARRRGLMLQQQADAFSHTVRDTVLLGRTPYRLDGQWDAREDIDAAHTALARVGLMEKTGADITRLSGGERQRVALATLLAQEPDLMLMDEPTAHQDVARQLAIMRLCRELVDSHRHAIVASCHDINLAARFATHVLILGEGVRWMGPRDAVLKPETLEAAFGCRFQQLEGVFIAS